MFWNKADSTSNQRGKAILENKLSNNEMVLNTPLNFMLVLGVNVFVTWCSGSA